MDEQADAKQPPPEPTLPATMPTSRPSTPTSQDGAVGGRSLTPAGRPKSPKANGAMPKNPQAYVGCIPRVSAAQAERAAVSDARAQAAPNDMRAQTSGRSKKQKACYICHEVSDHTGPAQCPVWKLASINDRVLALHIRERCLCCLKPLVDHRSAPCAKRECIHCPGEHHNTWLCPFVEQMMGTPQTAVTTITKALPPVTYKAPERYVSRERPRSDRASQRPPRTGNDRQRARDRSHDRRRQRQEPRSQSRDHSRREYNGRR